MVDNREWLEPVRMLDFLRDVGGANAVFSSGQVLHLVGDDGAGRGAAGRPPQTTVAYIGQKGALS